MNIDILCQLLGARINPDKFQFRGSEIKWLIEPTKEELAIVDDVIKNYPALETEYLNKQINEKECADTLACLSDIDLKSIRAIRELLTGSNPSAIDHLKGYEATAKAHRNNLLSVNIEEIK